jgi:hypothetical protein
MLTARAVHEVCDLCLWQDDGQDDLHADGIWGGPNGSLSLTEARDNFRDHFSKWDADDPMSEPYSVCVTEARRAMVAAFEGMKGDLSMERYEGVWQRVLACKQVLRKELTKAVFDQKWTHQRDERRWAYWERRYGSDWVRRRREEIAQSRQLLNAARARRAGVRASEIQ